MGKSIDWSREGYTGMRSSEALLLWCEVSLTPVPWLVLPKRWLKQLEGEQRSTLHHKPRNNTAGLMRYVNFVAVDEEQLSL